MMKLQIPSPIVRLKSEFLNQYGIELWLKRDDLIHDKISGNKWRKLELNILKAKQKNRPILTFGGAYSNHILATAVACEQAGIQSIGMIRGEELDKKELNPTLEDARSAGMELHFISREEYTRKSEESYIKGLEEEFGQVQLVPEGGANYYGVMGCTKILSEVDNEFDVVCCSGGTGTTATGMLLKLREEQKLELYPALKGGDFITENVEHLLKYSLFENDLVAETKQSLSVVADYHFGGYGKANQELVEFVNSFYETYAIPLDLVYTGKMLFGLFDRISKKVYPKGTRIIAIHTGGVQGNRGMAERFGFELEF